MNQNHNENRGVHSKSFISCTGEVTALVLVIHIYIKATHHEWNNSKEERFPLWLPRTPLCVWLRCCDHLKSFTQKEIHTLQGQIFIVMELSIQGTLVRQLSTWKWHYCAVSVKSVRFGREYKQSISNIFLISHILWHISKMAAIDLESSSWVKNWNMLRFLWK